VGALGGGGGTEFRQTCRPNDVIVGFEFRSGAALDAIAAVCAGLNPERTEGVTKLEGPNDNWYHIEWPAGEGWVYSGPDYRSLNCP
jgi:hypothetical protein